MDILVTGAFGNIGMAAVRALAAAGHRVRALDLRTPANLRAAVRMGRMCDVVWGDLRRPSDVAAAVRGQDAVVHLAFVIPRLSATGVNSEDRPDWAQDINVGGTRALLSAMAAQPVPPRLVFASSMHVYGRTQDQRPPRRVSDPVHPVEHYAHHKVACEEMTRDYPGPWTILRFAAAMPIRLILDPGIFDVPLGNRIEYVHSRDVATAIAHAIETPEAWGRVWHIGGGQDCQLYYRDLVKQVLDGTGLGMLPAEAFPTAQFGTDWLDTEESQRVLQFQSLTLKDYVREVRAAMGWRRWFMPLVRPIIRRKLLSQSPYYRARKVGVKGLPQGSPAA